MRILFISNDLIGGNLAYLLTKEGHEVKLYIEDRDRRNNFANLVAQTKNWKKELEWVGKDGLIIFDDVGYGKEQDSLRKKGYKVFGGSALGDKIEQDREFGNKIFAKYGIKTPPLFDFDNIKDAVEFLDNHKKPWVVKQNNHHYSKVLNYVGKYNDGRDVKSLLLNYLSNPKVKNEKLTLQEKVVGVEIGVGRYFNGNSFVGPIEYNAEHPYFFPGDIGPLTSEMGTVAWYGENESEKMYQETLAKIEPFLKEIDFRGDFEIDCIVNESGATAIECTARIGSPIVHLHSELNLSPWGEFMYAIASGEQYKLKWKKGFGIVILLAVPPFPYVARIQENLLQNVCIYFEDTSEEFMSHVHFEEVSVNNQGAHYISDNRGYILYVTGVAKTPRECMELVYDRINKIAIPKMLYRNDIGLKFSNENLKKLREWGYFR